MWNLKSLPCKRGFKFKQYVLIEYYTTIQISR